MKIENDNVKLRNKDICWKLLIVLLAACFVTPEISFILILFFIAIGILKHNKIFLKINSQVWCLIIILILGIVMNYYSGYSISNHAILRYIYYILYPISCLYFGYTVIKEYSIESILKTVFIVGTLNILQIYLQMIINIKDYGFSYNSLRLAKTVMTDLTLYVFFIYLLRKTDNYIISEKLDKIVFALDIIAILLTFSRTHLLYLVCGLLIYSIYYWSTRKYRKYLITAVFLGIIATVVVINNPTLNKFITEYMEKLETSMTEVSSKNERWNFEEINNSWRGFEIYSAKQQFQKADIIQKVFGTGSKGIYLGNYASLVSNSSEDGYIPLLHNGYYAVIAYSGVFGLVVYIIFYLLKIRTAIKCYLSYKEPLAVLLTIISVGSMVSTYIVMGLISSTSGVLFTCIMFSILQNYCIKRQEIQLKGNENETVINCTKL